MRRRFASVYALVRLDLDRDDFHSNNTHTNTGIDIYSDSYAQIGNDLHTAPRCRNADSNTIRTGAQAPCHAARSS